MKIVAIIQARMGSTRLPGKVLADICGRPLLRRLLDRVLSVREIDETVVATSTSATDDSLAEWLMEQGVSFFRGSENDVLDRYYNCAVAHGADVVVRVTADDPLKDPSVIAKAIRLLCGTAGTDYCSNTLHPTYPEGLDIEILTFAALRKAHEQAHLPSEREHVTPYIWTHKEQFNIVEFSHTQDLSHWRWTVDKPEDLEFVRAIFEAFQDDPLVPFEKIVKYLNANKGLLDINTGRTVRNEGYIKTLAQERL